MRREPSPAHSTYSGTVVHLRRPVLRRQAQDRAERLPAGTGCVLPAPRGHDFAGGDDGRPANIGRRARWRCIACSCSCSGIGRRGACCGADAGMLGEQHRAQVCVCARARTCVCRKGGPLVAVSRVVRARARGGMDGRTGTGRCRRLT
jgi:hypothetical protein